MEIIKVNDTTVAKIEMVERRQIYNLTQLNERKAGLEKQITEIDAMIAALA